jgi:CDP-diglyceride synthetase
VNIALQVATPGWDWLPPVLRRARYWRVVRRFALWGPLIGGAPYAALVFTLPFIYLIGLVPALLAGMLFGAWLLAPGRRYPNKTWRAALGALCGALACAVVALAVDPRGLLMTWAYLALHGVPAALLLALTQKPTVDAEHDRSAA